MVWYGKEDTSMAKRNVKFSQCELQRARAREQAERVRQRKAYLRSPEGIAKARQDRLSYKAFRLKENGWRIFSLATGHEAVRDSEIEAVAMSGFVAKKDGEEDKEFKA